MSISNRTSVAEIDDELVASLLLDLKHSTHTSDLLSGGRNSPATFRWGRRKARSRHARFVMDKECIKRATLSPTTPLSWSGSEASSLGSSSIRSKTYVELKEEERSLFQERHKLKKDLATMHLTMTHHQKANKNLKTIKRVNVCSKTMNNSNSTEASLPFTKHGLRYDIQPRVRTSISFDVDSAAKGRESFMLPDLNMLPSIDEEPIQQW